MTWLNKNLGTMDAQDGVVGLGLVGTEFRFSQVLFLRSFEIRVWLIWVWGQNTKELKRFAKPKQTGMTTRPHNLM